jgi:hypothetical protein
MSLKKILKCPGQAIVEYILIFLVLALAIVCVFDGFNPWQDQDSPGPELNLKTTFVTATDSAINQIASWR